MRSIKILSHRDALPFKIPRQAISGLARPVLTPP